eukprot:6023045-Pleurochrysis_carterae.AAC.1
MASPRQHGQLLLPAAMSAGQTAESRLGSVCLPCSFARSPPAASTAVTRVKFIPIPLTSMNCSPSGPVAIVEQMG